MNKQSLLLSLLLLSAASPSPAKEFSFEDVTERARELAAGPYKPFGTPLPAALLELNYDEWRKIKVRHEKEPWKGLPFALQLVHPGYIHREAVEVFRIRKGEPEPLSFRPENFQYTGRLQPKDFSADNLHHAGIRLLFERWSGEYKEIVSFLGASYFRAVGQAQHFGASARGIAMNTSSGAGEEFPAFRTFWLPDPKPGVVEQKILALLDGESVSGAYEFTIHPEIETIIDVRAVLFFRRTPATLGIAPLTSMFWYGENTRKPDQEHRPEVHDSDGLQIARRDGSWLWHPLTSSNSPVENTFFEENPRGFGLMQRDRKRTNYRDDEAHYQARPSVWIEPQSGWGRGSVRLLELPTHNEYMDNIVAFWAPETPPVPGKEYTVNYRMRWIGGDPIAPNIATVKATKFERENGRCKFTIQFEPGYAGPGPETSPVEVTTNREAQIVSATARQTSSGWLVEIIAPIPHHSTWITCELKRNGKTISEQWHQNLHP